VERGPGRPLGFYESLFGGTGAGAVPRWPRGASAAPLRRSGPLLGGGRCPVPPATYGISPPRVAHDPPSPSVGALGSRSPPRSPPPLPPVSRVDAQEDMQAPCLSSACPWSAAAQQHSCSAFAKEAFQGGLVSQKPHKNQRADSSKCLLLAWKPKSFQPPMWGQHLLGVIMRCLNERMTQAGYTGVILISLFCYLR